MSVVWVPDRPRWPRLPADELSAVTIDDVFDDVYNILKYMNFALAGFAFVALALLVSILLMIFGYRMADGAFFWGRQPATVGINNLDQPGKQRGGRACPVF